MEEPKLKYDYVRKPTVLPEWWQDMQMVPLPFESDVGVRILFRKFFQIFKDEQTPTDCNWYSGDTERMFDHNVVDWQMTLYGPFNAVTFKNCCDLLPQDYVFYARRNGNIYGTPPDDWPVFITLPGGYDEIRKCVAFYVERTWLRNMRINDFFLALGYGIPNRNAIVRPPEGALVGRAALPPVVIYVHDTYSKFSNNGMDWVQKFFQR